MKNILAILLMTVFCLTSFANSPGAIGVRKPVGTPFVLDTSSTNVTSGAWVTFAAANTVLYACSAVLVHNPGTQPIKVGVGAAASEAELGLVLPVGVPTLVPVETKKGVRIAVRSMGGTQSSGIITWSCFQ